MASNISVVLTIDNQSYIANLNKAEQATKAFASGADASVNKTNDSFTKLNNTTGALNNGISRLKGAIAGAAFIGFARSAIQMADAIQDLSNSTGIAVGNIVAFQNATKAAGGSAEGAAKGLQSFYLQIDAAAEGSAKLQAAFQSVGVSLDDLSKMSETDLLAKTLEGLAGMESSAAKTALQAELLGKAFRGVTIDGDFIAKLKAGDAETVKLADSIQRAAALNDQWEESFAKIRLAFLEAFAPIIKTVAKLLEDMPSLINLFKVLGAVIIGITAATGLRSLVGLLGGAAKGAQVLASGLSKVRDRVTGGITKKASTPAEKITAASGVAGGAGLLVGAGVGVASMLGGEAEVAAESNKKEASAAREVESAYKKKAQAVQETVDAYKRSIGALSENLDLETGLIGKSKITADTAKAVADLRKREADEIQKLTQAKANLSKEDEKLGVGAVYDKQIAAVRELTSAEEQRLKKSVELNNMIQQKENLRLFGIQAQITLSKELENLQAQAASINLPEIEKRYKAIDKAAKDSAVSAIAAEEARRGSPMTDAEKLNYFEQAAKGTEKLKQATADLLAVELQRDAVLFGIKQQINLQEQLITLQNEQAKGGLSEIEKKYFDIEAAANAAARAQIQQQQIKLGRDLSISEQKAYYDAAIKGVNDLKEATRAAYEDSRRFETGWKRAFKSYVDEATNAAKRAERLFEKAMSGMEDLIVGFVKTGKFEWKSFVASMAEELLRSQIKQTFASIMGEMSGGSGILGSIGSLFGFGGGTGAGQGASAQNPMYVYDVAGGGGGGFGGGTFGGAGGGGGGGISGIFNSVKNVFGGIADSVGNVFGGIADTVGSVFGGIADTVGGIFGGGGGNSMISGGGFGGGNDSFFGGDSGGGFFDSITDTLGDFFGGFFANGGTLGAGKFGIAGENGPEFIGGPATVTPLGGSTNVTYNINAVDAQSFKALIASDPGFIHSVAMAGAGSIPRRR